jgi:hypothetical protein
MSPRAKRFARDLHGLGDLVDALRGQEQPSQLDGWTEVGPNVHARPAEHNPFRQLAGFVERFDAITTTAQTELRKRVRTIRDARTQRHRR